MSGASASPAMEKTAPPRHHAAPKYRTRLSPGIVLRAVPARISEQMALPTGPHAAARMKFVGVSAASRAHEAAQRQHWMPSDADLLPVELNFSAVGDGPEVSLLISNRLRLIVSACERCAFRGWRKTDTGWFMNIRSLVKRYVISIT